MLKYSTRAAKSVDGFILWVSELVRQNVKNVFKRMLVKMTEDRGRKTENGWRAEDGRRKAEDERQDS